MPTQHLNLSYAPVITYILKKLLIEIQRPVDRNSEACELTKHRDRSVRIPLVFGQVLQGIINIYNMATLKLLQACQKGVGWMDTEPDYNKYLTTGCLYMGHIAHPSTVSKDKVQHKDKKSQHLGPVKIKGHQL